MSKFSIKYTDAELLDHLKHSASVVGDPLSIEKYRELGFEPSDKTYSNRFGSWIKALELAGISNTNYKFGSRYTKEESINLLSLYFEENGGVLTYDIYKQKRYKPAHSSLRKKFGSWNNALSAAGISINCSVAEKYTDEQVIGFLQKVNGGEYITVKQFTKRCKDGPSVDTVIGKFGSWKNAIQAAGLVK
ncbi:hypothetical protein QUF84_21010 [Fictibacillus enclensis]|uniref:homing endonuclease associated repeat-containing protein n=1 Tax=Fictibacillus enclensis TaxID=1017270 RepID=UPI0025A29488|nr:hypothetical protein [Fictibacillus enclensis]MDM5339683.1 hypothetical protein [Fictibacillus enclensis]